MNWTVLIIFGVVVVIAVFRLYAIRGGGQDVSQSQLQEWMKQKSEICILDVRSKGEYDSGHVPGAINIDHGRVAANPNLLKQHAGKKIIVYCERGIRSRIAEKALIKAGFSGVYHLTGDMAAWRNAGLPAETPGA